MGSWAVWLTLLALHLAAWSLSKWRWRLPVPRTVSASPELSARVLRSTAGPALWRQLRQRPHAEQSRALPATAIPRRRARDALRPPSLGPTGISGLSGATLKATRHLGPQHGWRWKLRHEARHDAKSTTDPLARQQCTHNAHDGQLPDGGTSGACRASDGGGTAPASRQRASPTEPVTVVVPVAQNDSFPAGLPCAVPSALAATAIFSADTRTHPAAAEASLANNWFSRSPPVAGENGSVGPPQQQQRWECELRRHAGVFWLRIYLGRWH